jgi:hypothetical protein
VIQNGLYSGILYSLALSAGPKVTAFAIGNSPWGTPGSLVAECIPQAQAAVGSPAPPTQEETMFLFMDPATKNQYLVCGKGVLHLNLQDYRTFLTGGVPEYTLTAQLVSELLGEPQPA